MLKFVYLLALLTCAKICFGNVVMLDHRIVGGFPATRIDFRYQVSLRFTANMSHFCGGTILDDMHVLTAAHCVVMNGNVISARDVTVVAGDLLISRPSNNTVTRTGQNIFTHRNYSPRTFRSDIAVIRVSSFGNWSATINNITLATRTPSTNTQCVVSGWGVTNENSTFLSPHLQFVNVMIVDRNECNTAYDGDILPGMICAGYPTGGRDACQGDSGGPLVCNNVLVGVVSWGAGCGRPGYPGVYAEVANYGNWVSDEVTRSSSPSLLASVFVTIAALVSLSI